MNSKFLDKASLILGNGDWLAEEGGLGIISKDQNTDIGVNGEMFYRYYIDNKDSFAFSRNSEATSVNKDLEIATSGIDYGRVDYNDNLTGALLLETSRTNLQIWSEEFDNVVWTKDEVTIQSNAITSPDNTLTADKLVESTGINDRYVRDVFAVEAGNYYTLSVFAKYDSRQYIRLTSSNTAVLETQAYFDILNGTIANLEYGTAEIQELANGWYRLMITGEALVSTNVQIRIGITNSSTSPNYDGDGVSGTYLWGAQVEEGTYQSTYIPTSGTTVTRAEDAMSLTGLQTNGIVGATEGTWFVDWGNCNAFISGTGLSIYETATNNSAIRYQYRTDGKIQFRVYIGTTLQNIFFLDDDFTNHKMAVKWDGANVRICVNGGNIQNVSGEMNGINEFLTKVGSNLLNINQMQFYQTALTDEELIELTT